MLEDLANSFFFFSFSFSFFFYAQNKSEQSSIPTSSSKVDDGKAQEKKEGVVAKRKVEQMACKLVLSIHSYLYFFLIKVYKTDSFFLLPTPQTTHPTTVPVELLLR